LSVSIRNMMQSDLERVVALSSGSPEAPQWLLRDYEQVLVPEAEALLVRCAIVAAAGDDLQGFAIASWLPGEAAELETLMVVKEHRRQRIGGALLEACMRWAAKAGSSTLRLEVRASNVAALELYRSYGFCSTGARRAYYSSPGEDALLLQVSLR
jgi:[ribosomal protein S18]-alanine N-acetyltransferase